MRLKRLAASSYNLDMLSLEMFLVETADENYAELWTSPPATGPLSPETTFGKPALCISKEQERSVD